MLLAIALIGLIALLFNMDLLKGPYSKKSKENEEFVRILNDSTLPIPNKFKSQEKEIKHFRKQLAEAAATSHPLASEAFSAMKIKDLSLFTSIIQTAPLKTKEYLLKTNIFELFRKNKEINENVENKSAKEEYDFIKKIITIIFDNSAKEDASKDILTLVKTHMGSKNIKDPIEFLLSLGVSLNVVLKNNQTVLDQINAVLLKNPEVNNQDVQNIIQYLMSRGAKTYAELHQNK